MSSTPMIQIRFDRKPILHDGQVVTLGTFEVMYSELEAASIKPITMKSVAFIEENMTMPELGAMLHAVANEFQSDANKASEQEDIDAEDGLSDNA